MKRVGEERGAKCGEPQDMLPLHDKALWACRATEDGTLCVAPPIGLQEPPLRDVYGILVPDGIWHAESLWQHLTRYPPDNAMPANTWRRSARVMELVVTTTDPIRQWQTRA